MTRIVAFVLVTYFTLVKCESEPINLIDHVISSEISRMVPAITERLKESIDTHMGEVQNSLALIVSQLGDGVKLDIDDNEAVDDLENNKGGKKKISLFKPLELSESSLEVLVQNISESIQDNLIKGVEKTLDKFIDKKCENNTSVILSALNNLENTYSRLYKKLFQYTRHQISVFNSRLDSMGAPKEIPITQPLIGGRTDVSINNHI